jgi:hypothetical protein
MKLQNCTRRPSFSPPELLERKVGGEDSPSCLASRIGRMTATRQGRNKPSRTPPAKWLSCSVAGGEKDHGTNKCLFHVSRVFGPTSMIFPGGASMHHRKPRAETPECQCCRQKARNQKVGSPNPSGRTRFLNRLVQADAAHEVRKAGIAAQRVVGGVYFQ